MSVKRSRRVTSCWATVCMDGPLHTLGRAIPMGDDHTSRRTRRRIRPSGDHMRQRVTMAAVTSVLALSVAAATPASAITGGTVDEQNVFANVGLLVNYTDEGRFRCSGTLVTETVILTAAHCTEGTVG